MDKKEKETCFKDCAELIQSLSARVDDSESFFIVVRRGAPLLRQIGLWLRECNIVSPEMKLMVSFFGEKGIDSGALRAEFLSSIIVDMRKEIFPNGCPIDSMLYVQNDNFKVCGQITAVSISQGGPAPCFFDKCVYQMLVDPCIKIKPSITKHFTHSEQSLLNEVQSNPQKFSDIIIENGYTGAITDVNTNAIVETLMLSLINKRTVYLREFREGLNLFGVNKLLKDNQSLFETLFVRDDLRKEKVNANYVFSLLEPVYSVEGSSRRSVEELIMDNFQDLLISLEDENITGYAEALAYSESENYNENVKFQTAEL